MLIERAGNDDSLNDGPWMVDVLGKPGALESFFAVFFSLADAQYPTLLLAYCLYLLSDVPAAPALSC